MSSKEKIIKAAIEVFADKGKHGARMEGIAARAKINKAMVYYYYGSKDNLFREVLISIFAKIFGKVIGSLAKPGSEDEDPVDRLKNLVRANFETISQNPNFAKIALHAVANEEQDLRYAMESIQRNFNQFYPAHVFSFFEKGVAQKAFRNIDPKQTVVSIVGMNVFYFIGKPIAKIILGLDGAEEQVFLKAREESILDLLLYGILERKTEHAK